ncbi:hypothetical protein IMY05_C4645000100 [Salix suchowensis]|nr:hypothetical protein IMY05_C4645000100 [Salix suchowensis]
MRPSASLILSANLSGFPGMGLNDACTTLSAFEADEVGERTGRCTIDERREPNASAVDEQNSNWDDDCQSSQNVNSRMIEESESPLGKMNGAIAEPGGISNPVNNDMATEDNGLYVSPRATTAQKWPNAISGKSKAEADTTPKGPRTFVSLSLRGPEVSDLALRGERKIVDKKERAPVRSILRFSSKYCWAGGCTRIRVGRFESKVRVRSSRPTRIPRGETCLVLVLVLPVPHKGGELVLRQNGNEWKYDSSTLTSQDGTPTISYVAFYGDIEHEVLPVESGHRITLTYNLFFKNPRILRAPSHDINSHPLRIELEKALKDPMFMKDGAFLGWGLQYDYPVEARPTEDCRRRTNRLDFVADNLKGEDALVAQICEDLNLTTETYVIFSSKEQTEIVLRHIPNLSGVNEEDIHSYF